MAAQFNPQEPLDFSNGNISENWTHFKQELRLYLIATEKLKKLNRFKTNILLNCIGKQGGQIFYNLEFSLVNDEMSYNKVMRKFKESCILQKNLTLAP